VINFARRDNHLRELMDDPHCDRTKLMRTYRQFRWINRVVASWKSIFTSNLLRSIKPGGTITLLDVGCGLLDNGIYLHELAASHGYQLEVTGIDPSDTVAEMLTNHSLPSYFSYRQCYLHDIREAGETFDIVISNHLLHHLAEEQLTLVFGDLQRVTGRIALMNDLRRSMFSWAGFGIATLPLRWYSFLSIDGMRSIRRSYRPAEIREILATLPDSDGIWTVRKVFPFRMVVEFRKNECQDHEHSTDNFPRTGILA